MRGNLNEMEVSSLVDKKLKVMLIKLLISLERTLNEHRKFQGVQKMYKKVPNISYKTEIQNN